MIGAAASEARSRASRRAYRLFAVTGIELEYAVVDAALRPACVLEEAFRAVAGRPVSELERGDVGFSNELAAHVFEIKTRRPEASLRRAEAELVAGLRDFAAVLRDGFGARLLPTGMHPFMRPAETALWARAGRNIYAAYDRVFGVRGHGWLNVQSCHVNLPFGRSEGDTVALHNAIACLLPYLPAVAASSPIYEGAFGPYTDNRLAFYRTNQRRIPHVTGKVVPEYMTSYAQYRRDVLRPIYAALARVEGAERLRHEWVNSRGAILRFNRDAIEIRVLDTQECIGMDIAIAAFVRGALRWLVRQLRSGEQSLPPHAMLVADLDRVIRAGTGAEVLAGHLRRGHGRARRVPVRAVLSDLLERAEGETPGTERGYLRLVERRIERGNLAELLRRRIGRSARGSRRGAIASAYEELMDCLERNRPWAG